MNLNMVSLAPVTCPPFCCSARKWQRHFSLLRQRRPPERPIKAVTPRCYSPHMDDSPSRMDQRAHFAEFVRWHFDDLSGAYAEAGRNSLALIGFDAVVLTLGADRLVNPSGPSVMPVICGTCCLMFALAIALLAMIPRRVSSVNSLDLRQEWIAIANPDTPAKFRYPDQGLEHLLHSQASSTGGAPLLKIRKAAEFRGRCLSVAMSLSALGAIAYGISLLVSLRR